MTELENEDITLFKIMKYWSRGMTTKEISTTLKAEGIDLSHEQVMTRKKNMLKVFEDNELKKELNAYMLDSIDRIKEEFEELIKEAKDVLRESKYEGSNHQRLAAIRELRELLTQ